MIKVKLDKETINFLKSKSKLVSDKTIGVYFLKFNGEIVYVGKSKNIRNRIPQHISHGIKLFNDFSFIECSQNTLDSTELSYIIMHDPIFNKRDALTCGDSLEHFCISKNMQNIIYHEEQKFTFIQVKTESKETLEHIRDQEGYASIWVVIEKMIKYCNGKKL